MAGVNLVHYNIRMGRADWAGCGCSHGKGCASEKLVPEATVTQPGGGQNLPMGAGGKSSVRPAGKLASQSSSVYGWSFRSVLCLGASCLGIGSGLGRRWPAASPFPSVDRPRKKTNSAMRSGSPLSGFSLACPPASSASLVDGQNGPVGSLDSCAIGTEGLRLGQLGLATLGM